MKFTIEELDLMNALLNKEKGFLKEDLGLKEIDSSEYIDRLREVVILEIKLELFKWEGSL